MARIGKYFSLVKFSHTVFALPFALAGFLMGVSAREGNSFPWKTLLMVLVCMVSARSAAMAFNRFLDRDIDKLNVRTSMREIPAGVISPRSALLFTICCSLLFMGAAALINSLCFFLSPAALVVILGYSYTKRFTVLCHFVLGLGLSLAPAGAYIAVTGAFAWLPVLFSLLVLFWVGGFDIIYAMQDEAFDKQLRLKSLPALLGKNKALALSRICHFFSAGLLVIAGLYGHFGLYYWTGAACFTGLLIYQQTLVKPGDLRRVNLAFFTTNGLASILFFIFFCLDFFSK